MAATNFFRLERLVSHVTPFTVFWEPEHVLGMLHHIKVMYSTGHGKTTLIRTYVSENVICPIHRSNTMTDMN